MTWSRSWGATFRSSRRDGPTRRLCPFHDEKTPSFTVNPDRQTYKCFGCGKGGNVFRFLMDQEGMTFPEAVRLLAKERGIQIPETRGRTPEEEGRVEAVRRALASAQSFFLKHLQAPEGAEARAYLAHRGYDAAAVKRFGLGYAPAGWDTLLQAAARRRILPSVLEDAGLVVEREDGSGYYDRYRHRVIFPIADLQGEGRHLRGEGARPRRPPQVPERPRDGRLQEGGHALRPRSGARVDPPRAGRPS